MQGILNVAFANNAEVVYGAQGNFAQQVVLVVGKRLRGGDDNRFASVHAHGVKVFHVAHRNGVAVAVTHHFVLYLFPANQVLFDKHLRDDRQHLFDAGFELAWRVDTARTQPAKTVTRAHHNRVTKRFGGL